MSLLARPRSISSTVSELDTTEKHSINPVARLCLTNSPAMPHSVRRWQAVTTVAVLLLSITSSLLGLFRPGHYTDLAALLPRLYAQDAVVLVIAVPVLAAGLWTAWRGSTIGTVVWLGALAFMTYIWASYALTTTFNAFYLGYIALFSLSTFTLVGGILSLDADALHRDLQGRVRHRVYSGFLGLAAAGLATLWLSELVSATLTGATPAAIEAFGVQAAATYVIDLGLVVPSLAVTAAWLWQQRPWGYALTAVLLTFTAVLAPAITAITVVDVQAGVPMSLPVIAASIVPPLIGAAFAGKYLHALSTARNG